MILLCKAMSSVFKYLAKDQRKLGHNLLATELLIYHLDTVYILPKLIRCC